VLTGCNYGVAQNVVFTASANANKIGLQDQLQVTYTLQDAKNIQQMSPEGMNDFVVAAGPFQSSSSNIMIQGNNVQQTSNISWTYVLRPKHTGALAAPTLIAKDNAGHTYKSNPIQIQVVPGSIAARQRPQQSPFGDDPFGNGPDPFAAMMQQRQQMMQQRQRQMQQQQKQLQAEITDEKDLNKNLFIKVEVDKSKVHVGEQITASYKLYSRIPMQVGISKLPSLNGFWTQDFELPKGNLKPVEEIVNGQKYQVFLLKKSALFPQQTGTLELDPAEAQGVARIIVQTRQNPFGDMFGNDPFMKNFGSLMMNDPFFNNSFFNSVAYKDIPVHLKSTPVKITVTPLPEANKPANFGGAVGNFTIASKIDKENLTTDDAANFTITIKGSGNLKLIETPKLNLPNGLETFDPQVIDTVTGRTTTISGSKIITYSITPHTPGDYTIPPVAFSYFNPQSGSYVSLQTQPIMMHVKAGKHYNPNVISVSNNTALADIHNISTKPLNKLSLNNKPLLFSPVYWSMYGIPFFAFIGVIFWKRREEELSKDYISLKRRRANKIALQRLITAQKLLKQNLQKPFYVEISKAIWLYLSDKLNIPLSSLSRESALEALNHSKVPADLQQKIEYVVSECETALYANVGGTKQMNQAYKDAVNVISELEEII